VSGGDGEVFCVDMATSQIAYSRIKIFREQGKILEPGWAVDPASGEPVLEVGMEDHPSLTPLGGYKGQCLGMMVEILCAVLTGMPLDHQLSHLYEPPYDEPRKVGHFFLAIDIPTFTDSTSFKRRIAGLLDFVRQQTPGSGVEEVLNPGDLERARTSRRLEQGVPMDQGLYEEFHQIAEQESLVLQDAP
jgi:LDH2 family malate/lactate/ureidoglycolate dehydrogenase